MNFTDFVRNACVEQDTFRRGSFTGVNMRHDPDITCIFQGELSCHEMGLPSKYKLFERL
ncbi:hypothetical protein D3C76_1605110 [compost metagenome]